MTTDPPPGEPQYVAETPPNPLAIVSLVAGILWLFSVGSLVAVNTGHIGLRQIVRVGRHVVAHRLDPDSRVLSPEVATLWPPWASLTFY